MRIKFFLLLVLVCYFLGKNCIFAEQISITDKLGRAVKVKVPVERAAIVATEEIIPALDVWDRVVGVSKWAQEGCDLVKAFVTEYPHLRKPVVGQGMDVNVEAVMKVRPEIVVTWSVYPSSVKFLEERGITTVAIQPDTIDEVYELVRLHGKLFGKESRAEEVIREMDRVFAMVKERLSGVSGLPSRKVIVTWMRPTTVNGKFGIMQEIMTKLKVRNPAESVEERVVEVSPERIFEWNPDAIFTWGFANYDPSWFYSRPHWGVVKAVREGHVYKLPTWSTASPRIPLIMLLMAMKLYPERFSDVNFDREVDNFYKKVFGISLERVKTVER